MLAAPDLTHAVPSRLDLSDPAVVALLDHIARELAEEYVRLLRGATSEGASPAQRGGRRACR